MSRIACAVAVAITLCVSLTARCDDDGWSVIDVAADVGITPESLVVAGFDMPDVTTVLQRLTQAENLRAELLSRHQVAAEAASNVTVLGAQLMIDTEDQALPGQYQAAVAALENAKVAIDETRQALRQEALTGFAAQLVERLGIWRDGSSFRVAGEFRAVLRPLDEWRAIEIALRAERRAFRKGVPLDAEHGQLLNAVRSDSPVAEAQWRLQVYLDVAVGIFAAFGS